MSMEELKSEISHKVQVFAEEIAAKAIVTMAKEFADSVSTASGLGVVPVAKSESNPKVTPAASKAGKASALRPCKVDGCTFRSIAKGLCSRHYQKARNKAKAREAKRVEAQASEPVREAQNGNQAPASASA